MLAELVANPMPSLGEAPFNVKMTTGDPAGTAFEATFIHYPDMRILQLEHIGRADR